MGTEINKKDNLLNEYKNFKASFNNLKFEKDLTKDSYVYLVQDNTFVVFKSINNILYIIYSNEKKSIILYNLIDNKKMNEIKNAHNNYVTNFRYYLDKMNKRDLVISISAQDNNLKLWNINNLECLLNIQKIYNNGILSSACIINDNNQNFIVTCNFNIWDSESIKVFNLNGEKIKEIRDNSNDDFNDNNDRTFLIDIYYDNKYSKNYIIAGNWGFIKSYNYNTTKIYHKYCDNDKRTHYNFIITKKEKITLLIESGGDGNIRIWNFNSGLLLNKFKVCDKVNELRSICLWNNEYLFVGFCETIEIINFKTGKIIKGLICDNFRVNSIKKITHPKYGECLIVQGLKNEQIKLLINKE